ncbi:lysis system i-spanin subunit Rz [Pseudomonas farsensis]|uniref:Lysis system i-spanin subunit Rz n=1 Tax=Pseudomonas farsensis TaxID=2745492 RepID=A0ABU8QW80_9PSED
MTGLGWPAVAVVLMVGAVSGGSAAWVWQANDFGRQKAGYEEQLADKDLKYVREREAAASAALDQLAAQQAVRRNLEDRLQQQDQNHWKEMNDVQQAQARLRDRLATADVRLSVLVEAGSGTASGCGGRERKAPSAGDVVDGLIRAQLDPAHARRIIAITDEGDRGLIALKACQAFVRETTR